MNAGSCCTDRSILENLEEFSSGTRIETAVDETIFQFEFLRGNVLFDLDRVDEATAVFDRLISTKFRLSYVYNSLAENLIDQIKSGKSHDLDQVEEITDLLNNATDFAVALNDSTAMMITYRTIIDFLTYLDVIQFDTDQLELETIDHYQMKIEELETATTVKSQEQSPDKTSQRTKLASVFLAKEGNDIRVLLLCVDCGLTYDVFVDRLFLSKQYLLNGLYGENYATMENGRIMLPKEARCPTCNSYKYRVTDMMRSIILINVRHEHERSVTDQRFRIINLDFKSDDVKTIHDAIKFWQKQIRQGRDEPTP